MDEDIDASWTDNRLSMHGDVVHSRPVAVNFGTTDAPKVVVFYGGNDGWLRAVNGNRTRLRSARFPPAGSFGRSRPRISCRSSPGCAPKVLSVYYLDTPVTSATPKDYGIDGPITAFRGTIGGSGPTKTIHLRNDAPGRAIDLLRST